MNIKSLKFDKIWKSLKFLFVHIFIRILDIKRISRFKLLQLNHIRQLPKTTSKMFSLELIGNFRSYVEDIIFNLIYNNCLLIKTIVRKVVLSHSKKVVFTCYNKKPFKNMKTVFYFMLKCLFLFLRNLLFFPDFSSHITSVLMRKLRLASKFMMSQTGILIIAIHILFNFLWRKSSQAMKFIHDGI